jgi:hypothetical protein
MKKEAPTFWVTNFSNRNVTLADLAVNIRAYTSVNLLDKRHYQYTLEQLEKSEKEGSIFNKRTFIKKRLIPPVVVKEEMPFLKETVIPSRERSTLVIKETHYEELEISEDDQKKKDEEYADENAELADMDSIKPVITITKV